MLLCLTRFVLQHGTVSDQIYTAAMQFVSDQIYTVARRCESDHMIMHGTEAEHMS